MLVWGGEGVGDERGNSEKFSAQFFSKPKIALKCINFYKGAQYNLVLEICK